VPVWPSKPRRPGEALSEEERRILQQLIKVLDVSSFGTVLLIVQDGKVVQIEMAEKFRLP
jgi:hypothetical protein